MEQNQVNNRQSEQQNQNDINTPLLSIIIPVYNTYKYLSTLMWILKGQITDEVEIIIVDGSDEECNYFKDYKNTYYYHIENKTAGVSRNFGIEHSTGRYICFIDSDDIVTDNYVKKILNKIHTTTFDYCFFSWKMIGKLSCEVIITDNCPEWNMSVWTRVWSRKFIGEVRFNEEMVTSEDADFIQRLCNGKMYSDQCKKENITDILYMYFIGRTDNLCSLKSQGKIGTYLNE